MARINLYYLFCDYWLCNLGRSILSYARFRFIKRGRVAHIATYARFFQMRIFSSGRTDFGRALRVIFYTRALRGANANHSYYHLLSRSHLDLLPFANCCKMRSCAKVLKWSVKTMVPCAEVQNWSEKTMVCLAAPILPHRSGCVKCFFDLWWN